MKTHTNESKAELTHHLSQVLADSYTLYLKTHNFHWNVTGSNFQSLHLLFEAQYTELALAVDTIAERIRANGAYAPGSYAQFSKLTQIKESESKVSAHQMLKELTQDQAILVETLKKTFKVAEAMSDEVTCDLMTQRLTVHEKNAWMLRSHLED